MARTRPSSKKETVSEAAPPWTPTLSALALVVFAFFSGLFVGQELLHKPMEVPAPPAPPAAVTGAPAEAPPDAGAGAGAASGAIPAGHDDAAMKDAIAHTQDPQRLLLLARLFMDQRRTDLATAAARKAVSLDPGSAGAHALLALSLEDSPGARDEVKKELKKALALNPPADVKTAIRKELNRLSSVPAAP